MLAVCLEEDEAFEGTRRACCSGVFIEGVLAVERVRGCAPGEGGEFAGGVEVDVRVDYGVLGGFFSHSQKLFWISVFLNWESPD